MHNTAIQAESLSTSTDPTTTPASSVPISDSPSVKPAIKRRIGRGVGIFFLIVFLFCCWIGVFGGNLREVQAGKLYRSCQLTGSGYDAVSAKLVGNSLESVIHKEGIKTILNLRSGSMTDKRYAEEVEICQKEGVDHVDDFFSARALPPPDVMVKMLDTFDHARKPILVHCQAGSDRTGLACAVYAHLYMNKPLNEAVSSQLTWRYGHFKFTKTRPMDTFFELYRETGNGLSLRDWIVQKYPAVYASQTGGSG